MQVNHLATIRIPGRKDKIEIWKNSEDWMYLIQHIIVNEEDLSGSRQIIYLGFEMPEVIVNNKFYP